MPLSPREYEEKIEKGLKHFKGQDPKSVDIAKYLFEKEGIKDMKDLDYLVEKIYIKL